MSYYTDIKYLNFIGHRLPNFTKKKQDLWNCRCIICGDSAQNKKKSRGYFYRQKNDLFYKCHNCSVSMHFGTFLKQLDPQLYSQYVFERYSQGENGPKAHTDFEENIEFQKPKFDNNPLEGIAVRLDKLPETNEAVQYCLNRKIPVEKFSTLYYIEHTKDISKISEKYSDLKAPESRLLIPLYDEDGNLAGVTMRGLKNEALRYIMAKFEDNVPLIFGITKIDKTKPITIVEGAIDSLFLENAIACNGSSFGKIDTLQLPKELVTIVFDNQPRNKEISDLVERYIKLGYNVCIWPCTIKGKDVNEMVLNSIDEQKVIKENTFNGLMAQIKFTEWRNC